MERATKLLSFTADKREAVIFKNVVNGDRTLMLGLGRALGETMAVAIILSPSFGYFWDVLTNSNSNSIASNIALQFPEAAGLAVDRLIATGLVLFLITFGVNAIARRVASAGFSGADG